MLDKVILTYHMHVYQNDYIIHQCYNSVPKHHLLIHTFIYCIKEMGFGQLNFLTMKSRRCIL